MSGGQCRARRRCKPAMLKFPHEEVVTLELTHRPAAGAVELGTGFSHLPIQVDNLDALIETLLNKGTNSIR